MTLYKVFEANNVYGHGRIMIPMTRALTVMGHRTTTRITVRDTLFDQMACFIPVWSKELVVGPHTFRRLEEAYLGLSAERNRQEG